MSQLWQDQGTYDADSFTQQIVPLYTELLKQLKQHQTEPAAESHLLHLIQQTAAACRFRWTVRLPLKRPGSDYRKYEILYTDALITAMAVDALAEFRHAPPEDLAQQLLPGNLLKALQSDPVVWEDWRGYFLRAERGGLYGVSIQRRLEHRTHERTQQSLSAAARPPAPLGSGRAMLQAIKLGLANGELAYNHPGDVVQVDAAGRTFLEHPGILKWCSERLQLEEDINTLKNRFSRVKGLSRSAQGKQLFYGRFARQGRRCIGYVLADAATLWSGQAPRGQFAIERGSRQRC